MRFLETIALAPSRLRDAVSGLSNEQLDTRYRDGGWTIRQVVHHVPDSHLNAYLRFKLALTETEPVIKPYDEAACAQLRDVADTPIEVSLSLLEFLHRRWVILMRGLSEADWQRRFVHPEFGKPQKLEQTLALYAWHSEHHIAHVKQALARSF
jgi:uncharacterized damage-inducible protein DinB